MNTSERNKFIMSIHQAINARTNGQHINQHIIDNAFIMRSLGSTWNAVQEACKIGKNTAEKIRKELPGYEPSEEAIEYVKLTRNERSATLEQTTSWVVDGRLSRIQNRVLNFLDSDDFASQLMESPALAIKMLESAHKFVNAEQKLLIERSKIKTDTDLATVQVMADFVNAIKDDN